VPVIIRAARATPVRLRPANDGRGREPGGEDSATAFLLVKWLGVAYLAWIGVRLILSRTRKPDVVGDAWDERRRLFRRGFVTSMANPYAVIFFGALFPQFIDPSVPVPPQLLVLGVTYLVVDGTILLLWGWLYVRALNVLHDRWLDRMDGLCGVLMLAAAALLASKNLRPGP